MVAAVTLIRMVMTAGTTVEAVVVLLLMERALSRTEQIEEKGTEVAEEATPTTMDGRLAYMESSSSRWSLAKNTDYWVFTKKGSFSPYHRLVKILFL